VAQRHDQVSNSTSTNAQPTTISTENTEPLFPSVFEQEAIQTTLTQTRLQAAQLAHKADLSSIPSSTRSLKPLNNFLGQDRARASVEAGIALPYSGYNIFAVGTAGLGKRTMIKRLLQQHAKKCLLLTTGFMSIISKLVVSQSRYVLKQAWAVSLVIYYIKIGKTLLNN